MTDVVRSLVDLLGVDYTTAVCEGRAVLERTPFQRLLDVAAEKVHFYPVEFRDRLDELLDSVGRQVCSGIARSESGAPTVSFSEATHASAAPLTGFGFIRIGEDGRAYLISKSEHYHASLGHSFPGFRLLDNAARLGVPNATHNNTRGHIVRLLERELVRAANGIERGDGPSLQRALASSEPRVLNRVINLETGSLAVEAALKMMLARFYRLEPGAASPPYQGRAPVFLVMADEEGGAQANYHGTTMFAQILRGLWPDLGEGMARTDLFTVRAVRINDEADFKAAVRDCDAGKHKVAGFLHEIVLMNYGGVRLTERFLESAYSVCRDADIPVLVDEIQSCLWSPELFLFREYGLKPDFVSVGKGFPGGQYSASRILAAAPMDNLTQFGALVTNGQEELAALAYLVAMEFVSANGRAIREAGEHYERGLRSLAKKHPTAVAGVEGLRHLSSIFFNSVEKAERFTETLRERCIDISVQAYKPKYPPAALTKLPLISSPMMIDFLLSQMSDALKRL